MPLLTKSLLFYNGEKFSMKKFINKIKCLFKKTATETLTDSCPPDTPSPEEKPKSPKRKKHLRTLVFLSLFITLIWYSFIFEPNNIQIENLNIEVKNLPEGFEDVKIVQLSDLHSYGFDNREKKVLEMVRQINPDFIFITGDLIDHSTKDMDSVQTFWQELGRQYPEKVFVVLGNHEHNNIYIDSKSTKKRLTESGIVVLDNENQKIFQDEKYIYLVGVDDPRSGKDDLKKALENTEKDIPKILLAHSPEIIYSPNNPKEEKVDLILTGHTHGGQVKFPFLRAFWIPTKDRGKFDSGLFEVNGTPLYVNHGIGLSGLPIRFNCPPEITVIELEKKL